MADFQATVVIRRGPDEVFSFLVQAENNLVWQPTLVRAGNVTPGPVGVGSRFWERRRVLGVQVDTEFEVLEFEPARHLVSRAVSGPIPFWASYRLRPLGEGTALTAAGGIPDEAVPRFAAKAAARTARHELAGSLQQLKRVLEVSPVAVSAAV